MFLKGPCCMIFTLPQPPYNEMCLSTLQLSINKYCHICSSSLSFLFTKRALMWQRAVTPHPAKFSKTSPNMWTVRQSIGFIDPSSVICWDVQESWTRQAATLEVMKKIDWSVRVQLLTDWHCLLQLQTTLCRCSCVILRLVCLWFT